MPKIKALKSVNIANDNGCIEMLMKLHLSATHSTKTLLCMGVSTLMLSGCQMVSIQENKIDHAIQFRTSSIITSQNLSSDTASLLKILSYNSSSCMQNFKACVSHIESQSVIQADERYSALSELYLAKALAQSCASEACQDQSLSALDKSLRYSYAYLFKSEANPNQYAFDLRQMQVRTFYNYGLSRLISLQTENAELKQLPTQFEIDQQQYFLDFEHYPELKNLAVRSVQSSYSLNFSGFDKVNRQDGLGAEFVVSREIDAQIPNDFILDPLSHYADQPNPRIHYPEYLSVTAVLQPAKAEATAQEIIGSKSPFKLSLYNPYQYQMASLNQHDYTLTANYTAPFAYWLANNRLGKFGYLSLVDRAESLRMPHMYMLEPYQPNKKVVVLVHGLASSPETWVNLTNNILGDPKLRANYQVWVLAYSTNMPIAESRYQIQALLQQAFEKTQPNTPSASDAVIIGHSMGGIISRLLVSDADISKQAIPLMNYEQYLRMQQNPVIQDRFKFDNDLPFSRAVFVAAPHRGSELTDQWYVNLAKKLVKLPISFFDQVNIQLNGSNSTEGLVHSGPDDLSPNSRFMQLTNQVMPKTGLPYHSIIGNATKFSDTQKMSDGIVPYGSSHLEQAQSEKIFSGGHSIHAKPETILELRRILHEHLDAKP